MTTGVKAGVVLIGLWRLGIGLLASYGIYLLATDPTSSVDSFSAFTNQSNLIVAGFYLFSAAHALLTRRAEPASGAVRGAVTLYICVTGIVYYALLASPDETWEGRNLVMHVLVPIVVFCDWVFVGRNQSALRWWHPLAWLSYLLAYLFFILIRGEIVHRYPYFFLDVEDLGYGGVTLNALGFLAAFAALGYALLGVGRLNGLLRGGWRFHRREPSAAR